MLRWVQIWYVFLFSVLSLPYFSLCFVVCIQWTNNVQLWPEALGAIA